MTREQFGWIRPLLEQAYNEPNRGQSTYTGCGLLHTGCQWRALPSDFSQVAYGAPSGVERTERWRSEPAVAGAKKNQISAAREKQRRNACGTFLIVVSQRRIGQAAADGSWFYQLFWPSTDAGTHRRASGLCLGLTIWRRTPMKRRWRLPFAFWIPARPVVCKIVSSRVESVPTGRWRRLSAVAFGAARKGSFRARF